MKTWQCIVCGFVYDEEEGWEEDGIPPGTAWDDVPDDWLFRVRRRQDRF